MYTMVQNTQTIKRSATANADWSPKQACMLIVFNTNSFLPLAIMRTTTLFLILFFLRKYVYDSYHTASQ